MLSNLFKYSIYEKSNEPFVTIDEKQQKLATIGITDLSNIPVLNSKPVHWLHLSPKLLRFSMVSLDQKINFLKSYSIQYGLNVNEYMVFVEILHKFGIDSNNMSQFFTTITNNGIYGRSFIEYMNHIMSFGVKYNASNINGSYADFLTSLSKFGLEYKNDSQGFFIFLQNLRNVNIDHTYLQNTFGKTKFTAFVDNMVDILYLNYKDFQYYILPVLENFKKTDIIILLQKQSEPINVMAANSQQLSSLKNNLEDFTRPMNLYTHEIANKTGIPMFNKQNPRNFMIGLSKFNASTNNTYNIIDLKAVVPFLKHDEYNNIKMGKHQFIKDRLKFIDDVANAIMKFMKTNYLKVDNVSMEAYNNYLITYNILKIFPRYSYEFICLNLYNNTFFDQYNKADNQYYQGSMREGFLNGKPIDTLSYRSDTGFQSLIINTGYSIYK
jgi:hypothetical protein